MNVLAPHPTLRESQQISPNRAKTGVSVLDKVKNGPKRPENGPKRAKIYEKGVLGPKVTCFYEIFGTSGKSGQF